MVISPRSRGTLTPSVLLPLVWVSVSVRRNIPGVCFSRLRAVVHFLGRPLQWELLKFAGSSLGLAGAMLVDSSFHADCSRQVYIAQAVFRRGVYRISLPVGGLVLQPV